MGKGVILMKCTKENIEKVSELVLDHLECEGEFDKETDLLHAFKTAIEWIEGETNG